MRDGRDGRWSQFEALGDATRQGKATYVLKGLYYKASNYLRGAYRYLNSPEPRPIPMQDLFHAVLVNKSQLKSSETYVEYDQEGYADIPAPRIVEAFESTSAPGKHDGSKIVETMLDLYERPGGVAMRA
jgi:hypothetical protein